MLLNNNYEGERDGSVSGLYAGLYLRIAAAPFVYLLTNRESENVEAVFHTVNFHPTVNFCPRNPNDSALNHYLRGPLTYSRRSCLPCFSSAKGSSCMPAFVIGSTTNASILNVG